KGPFWWASRSAPRRAPPQPRPPPRWPRHVPGSFVDWSVSYRLLGAYPRRPPPRYWCFSAVHRASPYSPSATVPDILPPSAVPANWPENWNATRVPSVGRELCRRTVLAATVPLSSPEANSPENWNATRVPSVGRELCRRTVLAATVPLSS